MGLGSPIVGYVSASSQLISSGMAFTGAIMVFIGLTSIYFALIRK